VKKQAQKIDTIHNTGKSTQSQWRLFWIVLLIIILIFVLWGAYNWIVETAKLEALDTIYPHNG
jgi:hypothetical protein